MSCFQSCLKQIFSATFVYKFQKTQYEFYFTKDRYTEAEQKNMIFEFQTWMFNEIIESQKRLSIKSDFSFTGGKAMENEAGHIACMTNQLREILYDVRIEAIRYYNDKATELP